METINIISYNIIKCKERITVKVYKDKKNKKLLRDNNGNIIGDIKKEYYNYNNNNNDNNIDYLDCNKHIIDKAGTCLVESFNGSLRNTFARFRRKTKAFSKNIKVIEKIYLYLLIKNYI